MLKYSSSMHVFVWKYECEKTMTIYVFGRTTILKPPKYTVSQMYLLNFNLNSRSKKLHMYSFS